MKNRFVKKENHNNADLCISYSREKHAGLIIFILVLFLVRASRWTFSAARDRYMYTRGSQEPFCRTLFPTAFQKRATSFLRSFVRNLPHENPLGPCHRFYASVHREPRYSSPFARGRARRMDGIGLFHFRTECLPIIRFCERRWSLAIRRVNILLIVVCRLASDVACARAKNCDLAFERYRFTHLIDDSSGLGDRCKTRLI